MKVLTSCLMALLAVPASAQSPAAIYSETGTIPWSPKAPSSVDQSVIYNDTYYLSDRTNSGVSIRYIVFLPANSLIGSCCLPR